MNVNLNGNGDDFNSYPVCSSICPGVQKIFASSCILSQNLSVSCKGSFDSLYYPSDDNQHFLRNDHWLFSFPALAKFSGPPLHQNFSGFLLVYSMGRSMNYRGQLWWQIIWKRERVLNNIKGDIKKAFEVKIKNQGCRCFMFLKERSK